MRHGAPPLLLEDETLPNGPRIDVGRRVGWLLRTARFLSPASPRLQDIADHLGSSVALVHRAEMGTIRSGRICGAYEDVLGLAPGAIRGPVGALARTFPYGPADRDPGPPVTSVVEMSALTDRVAQAAPHAGDWLAWAQALAQSGAIGLPVDLAAQLIGKLVSEMDRAVGSGYPTRYEALALMRCGPYGEVMVDVARARVEDPHVQVLADLMSAVGELASPSAIGWCLDLLRDPRDRVVTAAVFSLENMASISPDQDFWGPLIEPVLHVYNDTDPDSEAWRWLSHLLRLIPAARMSPPPVQPCRPLAPSTHTIDGSAPYLAHLEEAVAIAQATTDAHGLRTEPMLARLVYDIAFGPHETRAVTGYMLLSALPGMTATLVEQISTVAESHPDPIIRDRAARRLVGFACDSAPERVEEWLAGDDAALLHAGLRLAGTAGLHVPDDLLRRATRADATSTAALYAAGMTAHPVLGQLATDTDPGLRGAAEWWLRAGPRVLDPGPDPRIWGCRATT